MDRDVEAPVHQGEEAGLRVTLLVSLDKPPFGGSDGGLLPESAALVRGCLEWQRSGLRPPGAVADATAAYRREADAVGRFLDERCALRGDLSQPAGALLAAFEAWVREAQAPPVSPQDFVRRLAERGLAKARRRAGYVWEGLALRDEGTTGEPS